MDTELETLRAELAAEGVEQGHLLRFWDELSERARRRLKRQLLAIDFSQLGAMREAIRRAEERQPRNLRPAPVFELESDKFPYLLNTGARAVTPMGEKALRDRQVACLLVAGGQGTRLGFSGPKGCYPLLPLSGMTLFEVFARKLRRAGREYGAPPPIYLMLSEQNQAETRKFFQDHDYFGLNPKDVLFFVQGTLPAMNREGKLLLAAKDRIAQTPDGHGGVLGALQGSGMLADMRSRGIRLLSYIQVDNVQAPVIDPVFLGIHLAEGAEVSLKVVRKVDAEERVGVFCEDDGVPGIAEYSEFSDEQAHELGKDGRLAFWAGSIAVHCFGVDFLMRLAGRGADLALHAALRDVPHLDDSGAEVAEDKQAAWKFERFIFDAIPEAAKVVALEVPRDEQFLPLKNQDGPFGPDGVKEALRGYWRGAVKAALGAAPPELELDPLLCENARELIEFLRGMPGAAGLDLTEPLRLSAEEE